MINTVRVPLAHGGYIDIEVGSGRLAWGGGGGVGTPIIGGGGVSSGTSRSFKGHGGGGAGGNIDHREFQKAADTAATRQSLEDMITDALTDSLGPGWTCRDGARAVLAAMRRALG